MSKDATYLFQTVVVQSSINAPQIQQPDTAYDFRNIKKRDKCKSPIHQEASNTISSNSDQKQRKYSIFSNEVKIAKFSKIFASMTPNFRLFIVILKVHDERNKMTFVSSKSAV